MEYQIINEIMVIDHNCINKQIVKKIRKYMLYIVLQIAIEKYKIWIKRKQG